MPRDTQPQQPDELYARAIFTQREFAALTAEDRALLDADLLAGLDEQRQLGWNFSVDQVVNGTQVLATGDVVVSKSVRAYPFGVTEL
jgi:hypothetical protein